MMSKEKSPRTALYIPQWAQDERLLERLREMAKEQRRSLNFMIVEAIKYYLEHQEKHEN